MAKVVYRLDEIEKKVMSGLKDFQESTVNRIDYLFSHKQRRVLVSDEVGLGKTLIARGVIAKFAKLRYKEHDPLVKIVYICSNSAIAEQNLRKLCITREVRLESATSSRLSMQHLNISRQENDPELLDSYIQLIPLTPDTSFRMTSGTGTVSERALMYAFLRRLHEFRIYSDELDVAMMDYAYSAWEKYRDDYENQVVECNLMSDGKYLEYMMNKLKDELYQEWYDGITYIEALKDLCRRIRDNRNRRVSDNEIIGQLRVIFAKISLEKLEPDLVIMDEFQRFKYLLDSDPDTETGMLANKFFHSKGVRMLLLSATPYKMYSTPEEIDEAQIDEHYTEFLSVMKFLNGSAKKDKAFVEVWKDYSIKLKELTLDDTTIFVAKNAAEDAMYQTVCRTERIAAKESADIIDDSDVDVPLEVLEKDILSYVQAQELLDEIGANYHVPVDYIKSTPYIMSFMKDYQLKRNVERYFKRHSNEIKKIEKDTFWIRRKYLDRYDKIPNNNARLERVMNKVLQNETEKLLWMPPSKPYYEMQGVYKDSALASKTLIFSAWEMVPRMLASLISYEAERRTVGKIAKDRKDSNAHYFYGKGKRYPSARMNFSLNGDGTPKSMSLFCLIYPSMFLSDCYDPIQCMNEKLGINDIQKRIREQIAKKLDEYPCKDTGKVDDGWYYLAPLLMDGEEYARRWLNGINELEDYDEEEEKSKNSKGYNAHLSKLRDLYDKVLSEGSLKLGKRPEDLISVLTDMAIASPAICINRAYRKYLSGSEELSIYKPTQLSRAFLNRMNTPEATAVVELASGRNSEEAHWQDLLTYCKHGNLQAVFDEYAHLITSGIDNSKSLVDQMHSQMIKAMSIKTTPYEIDTFTSFQKRSCGQKNSGSTRIRTHFAVAFTKGEGRESDTDRKKTVRNAFNSPFRPFVLATTSIGQEGLDFHNYCRRIVHWNLPSNPIDLEQREGRINRFECLAIRQNVAMRYGDIKFHKDVWNEMFDKASKVEKTSGSSDLIPFWGLRASDNMVKIERIVPMYPYSRDGLAYERLIKILSLYRLTLGQARQEELLEYLFKNCDDPDKLKELFINLSPFYKGEKNDS